MSDMVKKALINMAQRRSQVLKKQKPPPITKPRRWLKDKPITTRAFIDLAEKRSKLLSKPDGETLLEQAGVTKTTLAIPFSFGPFGTHYFSLSGEPGDQPTEYGYDLFGPGDPEPGEVILPAVPPPFQPPPPIYAENITPEFRERLTDKYKEIVIERYKEIGIPRVTLPEIPDILGPLKDLGKYALIGIAGLIAIMFLTRK